MWNGFQGNNFRELIPMNPLKDHEKNAAELQDLVLTPPPFVTSTCLVPPFLSSPLFQIFTSFRNVYFTGPQMLLTFILYVKFVYFWLLLLALFY